MGLQQRRRRLSFVIDVSTIFFAVGRRPRPPKHGVRSLGGIGLTFHEGTVIEVHSARCVVDSGDGEAIECRYKKRLGQTDRKAQALVVVGDRVRYEPDGAAGVVFEVLPRRNALTRRASRGRAVTQIFAANVDHAVIVAAVAEPPLRIGFIDRCLASALVYDVAPIVVLNKADLLDEESRPRVESIRDVYKAAGFPTFLVSIARHEGLASLVATLVTRTSVVIGQSGVGKTTLLNALLPGLSQRTRSVSHATGKGMHTTTGSRLFRLPGGGFVVDTPGVRAFGLEPMEAVQIALAYPEFHAHVGDCRFSACTHLHEPGCAVRAAVDAGVVAGWRYATYARIVQSLDGEA
jgi:ribosome biogenesis GTPase